MSAKHKCCVKCVVMLLLTQGEEQLTKYTELAGIARSDKEEIMMKVIIRETRKMEQLQMLDNETGTDCTIDIIGNYGGLNGQFVYDEESDVYHCNQDTFVWWERVLDEQQELNDRIAELKKEYGSERVQEVLEAVGDFDLEDQANEINAALDETFA